jgi:hypothetical protein
MAVPLSISTNISGLGVSLAWTASITNTQGHLLSEPGPGVTMYLAGTPASWSALYADGKLYNVTGSTFVFTSEPAGWAGLSGTTNFTVYWEDAAGVQRYAYSVPMTPSGSFPARTWTATNAAYGGASVTPTNGDTSVTATGMFRLVISPEQTDAAAVPGSGSSPVLAQMFVGAQRTGLIVLTDGTTAQPFLVGPYSGVVWSGGAGANPIAALASTGVTNVIFSTADTSTISPICVGYYTA